MLEQLEFRPARIDPVVVRQLGEGAVLEQIADRARTEDFALVAPTMVIRWPDLASAHWNSWPISCIAKSLNASVGPWNSSSRKWFAASCFSGARAGWPKPR
jgi:hypothetical protein